MKKAARPELFRKLPSVDDVMRISRVSAVALRVEADRAQRARDLREPAERRDAFVMLDGKRLDATRDRGASDAAAVGPQDGQALHVARRRTRRRRSR